jgi:hypothetical protein
MSSLDYHPLFYPEDGVTHDGYEPEPILQIELTRRTARGAERIPRVFDPTEIRSYQEIADMYGGGVYDLVARRPNGTVYTRRLVNLAGNPKPLVAEGVDPSSRAANTPAAPAPASPALGSSSLAGDPIFALLISQMQESQRAMSTIMAAAMTALAGRGESAAETMRTIVPLLAPLMQPPAPAPAQSAPLREVLEVSKLIREEARSQAEQRRESEPVEPDDMAGQIKGIVEAVAPIMLHVASSSSGSGTP